MSHECTKCRGTGKCPVCGGSGKFVEGIIAASNMFKEKDICPFCRGNQKCSTCRGIGQITVEGHGLLRPRFG